MLQSHCKTMKIYKNKLVKDELEIAESLLFNGNGHIGVRNVLEENDYDFFSSNRHTYLNGFSDTYAINYPEQYFGASVTGEQMLTVIDGTLSKIKIGGQPITIDNCVITDHTRYLDIEIGQSVRQYTVEDQDGNKTKIEYKRIASFTNKEQLITKYKFEPINHMLDIQIETTINFCPDHNVEKDDPRVGHNTFTLDIIENNLDEKRVKFAAPNSKQVAYFGWEISDVTCVESDERGITVMSQVNNNVFTKAYTYSLTEFIKPITDFALLENAQIEYLQKFWNVAKVKVECQDNIEDSINYGTYALLQSVGQKSIAAKGLSGIGYEGHVFWDAEMYVFPLFNKIAPNIAREMLEYRIQMLPKAIENRKIVGYPCGALYPWRTITGLESSSFFEAGMAQHHINLDISYALNSYIEQTGDRSILVDGGFEMVYQIGQMFASLVYKRDEKYHLDMVTGPDEYSALVNDNFYTNGLLKLHFKNLLNYIEIDGGQNFTIPEQEQQLFADIAANIALEFDEQKQIAKQDRDFLNKDKWPYEIIGDKPLLLKYHPLEIYRHQVSKQADVVLGMQLFGREVTTPQIIANTIEYYDQVTTHDSSLSFSNFATVYGRLQNPKGYDYFLKNAKLDIENLHHNTKDGIHTASMGGTYQTLIDGFSNYQIENGAITVENLLPPQISNLEYKVYFQNELYKIKIQQGLEPIVEKMEDLCTKEYYLI